VWNQNLVAEQQARALMTDIAAVLPSRR
jgi:hypothetical protein